MDFGRWFDEQKTWGRFPKYSEDLVEGFKKHGYTPEKWGEGYRIVPIESGEQRGPDQLGNFHGRGESSRASGARVEPESIPDSSGLAGADLNPASGYWAEISTQDHVMTPASGMADDQVSYLQGLDFAALNQDFGDPMDFFGPGVALESLGHEGLAVLPGTPNSFVQEVPVVSVNSTRSIGDYVAFPDEVDAGMNTEPGHQAGIDVSGHAIPEESQIAIGVENFMMENPDWRKILYGPTAQGYPPQQGFNGMDYGPSPVDHGQSDSSRTFGQPPTSMEYGQPADVYGPSSLSHDLIGDAASENPSPLSSASRPGTPAPGRRTPDEVRVERLEQGIAALYQRRMAQLEQRVAGLQEQQGVPQQQWQGSQGAGSGASDVTAEERRMAVLERQVHGLWERRQTQPQPRPGYQPGPTQPRGSKRTR
ncbi:hypothetical protein ACJ6WF_15590 [Streptomyces sp. MMS24-I2-30]|uniref:hypothetical protein n=1 Tax=Streptomyces sp. MMS24-I2-30 TaxID=3351564 RepID=UPI003896917F